MTLLDPFIWVSPITILVGMGIAHLLGFSPELSLHYLGTMAVACFFGNFLSLAALIYGCIAVTAFRERKVKHHG
jgi:hypothetical protein